VVGWLDVDADEEDADDEVVVDDEVATFKPAMADKGS